MTHLPGWSVLSMIWLTFLPLANAQKIVTDNSPEIEQIPLVAQKVQKFQTTEKKAVLDLFAITENKSLNQNKNYKDFAIWKINDTTRKRIFQYDVPYMEITIPQSSEILAVYQVELSNSSKTHLEGKFYRGIIKDDWSSLVSLSIYDNQLAGTISDKNGNRIIQPIIGSKNESRVFEEKNVISRPKFDCHYSYDPQLFKSNKKSSNHQKNLDPDTVTVYLECDYSLYLNNNNSILNTSNYVTNLFNEVATIYANESILLLIDEIKIWSTIDPYDESNATAAISSFQGELQEQFNADLAQLISGSKNENGGIGFVNSLCDKTKAYSYANIDGSFSTVPSYSWDVHVMAHELGHNLGSPHTHDCTWGPGNDQAIDDCYSNNGLCNPGPTPIDGGTIMSYCHLSSYGVNFSLGFGTEPGNLIRSKIESCQQLEGYTCEMAKKITEPGNYSVSGPNQGSGAKHLPAQNANWYKFTPAEDGTISVGSCNQGVDTRLFLYSGTCSQLTQITSSDDDCASGQGYNYAAMFKDIAVTAGETYYIEWDDRWSSDGFTFQFGYSGSLSSCDNASQMNHIISENSDYHSSNVLTYDGMITQNAVLTLSSDSAIVLDAGFEINIGAQLEVMVEDCQTYLSRIEN